MPRPRIAFVGGGSVTWMPHILRDIVLTPELSAADIRLLDCDRKAGDLIAGLGKRYASEWNLGATFLATSDAARALDGTDAVVITISTGGLDAMAHDLHIPSRYGIHQTVGDTVGPGGWARGLRNIPVFVRFAEQIGKHAPRAFILNYSNPLGALTNVLARSTRQPVVGLCHGLFGNLRILQTVFGLKREEQLNATYGGLNHFFWMLDFSVNGRPGYPLLRAKLRGKKGLNDLIREAYRDSLGHSYRHHLVAAELFREFGFLPYLGDRHSSEFFSRYLAPDRSRLRQYKLVQTTIAERRQAKIKAWRQAEDLAAGKTPMEKSRSRETAADIIAARVTGRNFVDVVNLPNRGQIANLPVGVVVETPGVVNMQGFAPLIVGPLPAPLVPLVLPHAINQDLIVEAGICGDWDTAFRALINDPLCSHLTVPQIKKMGRELLTANRKHLPQFFGK